MIDESFWFCDKPSAIKYLKSYDKLYILKINDKVLFKVQELELGTIVSRKENISKIKRVWTYVETSHLDSIYLQEALNDKSSKLSQKR